MLNTSTPLLGASPTDVECAQQVKPLIVAAGGSTVGVVGLGLFSTYKFFKGRPAAGATGLVAAAALFGIGRVLASAAARQFTACRTQP